jgi:hypothetical protein
MSSHNIPGPSGINMIGFIKGRLTVVSFEGRASDNHLLWRCSCQCGKETVVQSTSLRRISGGTRSCGCLRSETSKKKSLVPWNKGKTYATGLTASNGRVFKQKQSWSKAVIRVNGSACQICGWNKAKCDVHHRIPRFAGGQNTLGNGIVLCPNCHRETHEKERLELVNNLATRSDE